MEPAKAMNSNIERRDFMLAAAATRRFAGWQAGLRRVAAAVNSH
jgi:hypothetical protein